MTFPRHRIAIVRMDAPLYFANAKFLEDRVRDVLRAAGVWARFVARGRVHPTVQAAVEMVAGAAGSPLLTPAADPHRPPEGFA